LQPPVRRGLTFGLPVRATVRHAFAVGERAGPASHAESEGARFVVAVRFRERGDFCRSHNLRIAQFKPGAARVADQ